jgi:transcriptional regulator with XRE-family HTH domain
MTASDFTAWLSAMNITAAEAARLLGVTPNTITRYKRKGGPVMLRLACAALYHRLER